MKLYESDWLYDLVHEKPPDGKHVAFYERQIDRFGQPVLELACGTGNYLVTFAEKHVDVAGLDNSPEMLGAAEKRSKSKKVESNLINADMRDFDLGQIFRLIFVAGNSFQHLNTKTDIESALACVRRHMDADSRFIAEVCNPSVALLSRDPATRFFVGEYKTDEGWVVIHENVLYDPATQINHIRWHYKNQYMKEERTVEFTMRQFFPQELDYLFESNGFSIESKYGDFDESSFSSKSPKQIVVAKKMDY